jgi:hypothetical protein
LERHPEKAPSKGGETYIAMHWLWTWGGECFGYREGDNLWTYNGKHVGCFHGDEVYAPDGWYLGEIRRGNRLVIDRSKSAQSKPRFVRCKDRLASPRLDYSPPLTLYLSCKDFPSPETF